MKPKILYIMSSYNLYGGTPKKTLDLMKYFGKNSVLYVYHNSYSELKSQFENTGGKIYGGFYGINYIKYVNQLLYIIDKEEISIVQTQFFKGETLGFLIKCFRPKIKLLICFVGALPSKPSKAKLQNFFFRKADFFVYISNYVKKEKEKQFPLLKCRQSRIIYNGTRKITPLQTIPAKKVFKLFAISGLIYIKNIQVLVKAMDILVNKHRIKNLLLSVAGDGPMRFELEEQIKAAHINEHVQLLGYQDNIGGLLESCNIYVHPCFKEGFGIVIPEAMLAQKPIIVSDAGALPELIDHEQTGLIVPPHDANAWADAVLKLMKNPEFAKNLASSAQVKAQKEFSIERFVNDYENLYKSILAQTND